MSRRNVRKTIDGSRCLVNDYYDITVSELIEIAEMSETKIDAVANGFLFGYALGNRAERALHKNEPRANHEELKKTAGNSRGTVEK